MTRWIIALIALAAALPARAETWVQAGRGYAYDSDSLRYQADADAIFVVRRWTDGDSTVDSDLLILCTHQQRWRLIDAGTATWSGPFRLDPADDANRARWCEQGKGGRLAAYAGRLPVELGGPAPVTEPPAAAPLSEK